MLSKKDLDTALELIDNIVDQIRCVNCDNSTSSRGELSCGHVVCVKCIKSLTICPTCDQCITENIQSDPVLLKYSVHATTLLHVFQESVYNKNVMKSRISDQQKMEKELFPNCIQAPQKYFNRKKSINNKLMITNTSFSGEKVSRASNITPSKKVEQWLEQNESVLATNRTPFADLNVNSPISSSTPKSKRVSPRNVQKLKIDKSMSKHKSITKDNGSKPKKSDDVISNITIRKRSNSTTLSKRNSKLFKHESIMIPSTDDSKVESQNESLPEPESDEVITLDDSQTYVNEKDRQACLAVLAADKAFEQNTIIISDDTERVLTSQNVVQSIKVNTNTASKSETRKSGYLRKVPFYKKGPLYRETQENVYSFDTANVDYEPVSIVVETEDFVTKIEVSKCANEPFYKTSKCCQTDFVDNIESGSLQQASTYNKSNLIFNNVNKQNITKDNTESQDLFTCEKVIVEENILDDSDMSSDGCIGNNLVTTVAQIHNAGVQPHKVLSPLNHTAAASRMSVPKKQRYVASSDSSDKENRDPNIMKKCKGKKAAKKRKPK